MLLAGVNAQPATAQTIEGYWQDIAGRITYKPNPLPADRYGDWYTRALDATYPAAKHIRKEGSASWSPCRVLHSCRLTGDELLCAMEHRCKGGKEYVELKAEERFVRRAKCLRTQSRPEAQGFPVACS